MKLDDNLVHYLWAKEHPLRHESIIKEIEDERGLNYLDEFEVKHMFSVLPAMKDRRVSAETLTSLRVNINFAHVEKPVGTMIRILKSHISSMRSWTPKRPDFTSLSPAHAP